MKTNKPKQIDSDKDKKPKCLFFIDYELFFVKDTIYRYPSEQDSDKEPELVHVEHYFKFNFVDMMRKFSNNDNNVDYYVIEDKSLKLKKYSNKEGLITEWISKSNSLERIQDILNNIGQVEFIAFLVSNPNEYEKIKILELHKTIFFETCTSFIDFIDYNLSSNEQNNNFIQPFMYFSDGSWSNSSTFGDKERRTLVKQKRLEKEKELNYKEKMKKISLCRFYFYLIKQLLKIPTLFAKAGLDTRNIERFINSDYILTLVKNIDEKLKEFNEKNDLFNVNQTCVINQNNQTINIDEYHDNIDDLMNKAEKDIYINHDKYIKDMYINSNKYINTDDSCSESEYNDEYLNEFINDEIFNDQKSQSDQDGQNNKTEDIDLLDVLLCCEPIINNILFYISSYLKHLEVKQNNQTYSKSNLLLPIFLYSDIEDIKTSMNNFMEKIDDLESRLDNHIDSLVKKENIMEKHSLKKCKCKDQGENISNVDSLNM